MSKCIKKPLEHKLTCNSFPEPLLKKYGWDSCVSCSLSRSVPNRLRKYDSRRSNRSHDGNLINVKIFCDSSSESHKTTADMVGAEKENSTPCNPVAPLAVTPRCQRIGRDYQKQSQKWWTEHKDYVN
jgi:hypothetical protein